LREDRCLSEASMMQGRHLRSFDAAVCLVALLFTSAALAQAKTSTQGKALTASRFKVITWAEIEKMQTSGCSFSVDRGEQLIALWDTHDKAPDNVASTPQIWFKIDGNLTKVSGTAKKSAKTQYLGVWTGKVAGHDLRIIEGRIDPTFKNDGGSEGGDGQIEWKGARAQGSMRVFWQAGC
jgi:hypothetical protein